MSSKKEIFALGYSFKKLFLIFVIGSLFGTIYEQVLNLVKVYFQTREVVWELRRGVIYGPFNPLYGAGAVLFVILLVKPNYSKIKTFILGAIIGGVFEFIISFLQELVVNTTSWDYSNYILNIGGRTNVPYMIVWGALALVFAKFIYPYLSKWIEMIPIKIGNIIFYFLLIFLIIDMLISWTALFRSSMRRDGAEAISPIGKFYDRVYSDEVLAKSFPNMNFNIRKDR